MENNPTPKQHHGFRIYIGIINTLILLVVTAILVLLIVGAGRVIKQTKDLTPKVNQFLQQVQNINTNINNLNSQLQQQSKLTNTLIANTPKP